MWVLDETDNVFGHIDSTPSDETLRDIGIWKLFTALTDTGSVHLDNPQRLPIVIPFIVQIDKHTLSMIGRAYMSSLFQSVTRQRHDPNFNTKLLES